MKKNIVDIVIAFVVFILLMLGFIWTIPKQTDTETFTPPSWGTGRTEAATINKLPASYETPKIIEETATEPLEMQMTASKTEPETETEIESETFVEVIPAVEGKYLDVPMSAELQDFARTTSEAYKVPFELTMAVIYVESSFNVYAISDTKDHGLMQISYKVQDWLASELGITDFFDPYQNITAGVYVLADKISKSGGDFTQALMRYHDGDDGALGLMAQGIFSTEYTDTVLSKYYEYIREG